MANRDGGGESSRDIELIQGTLNILILKTLSWGPMNGFAIASWVRQTTGGDVELEEGALYPALHRMEHRGWLASEWRLTDKKRRAKYYHLTPTGRAMLAARTERWERLVQSVSAVLHATVQPV